MSQGMFFSFRFKSLKLPILIMIMYLVNGVKKEAETAISQETLKQLVVRLKNCFSTQYKDLQSGIQNTSWLWDVFPSVSTVSPALPAAIRCANSGETFNLTLPSGSSLPQE